MQFNQIIMKNLFTFLFVLCLFGTTYAQEPVQKSMFTKVTATWCVNCGTWGWAFFEDLKADNGDNAIYVKAHYSGDFINDPSRELATALGATGQPNFFMGENRLSIGSSNYQNELPTLQAMVDETATQVPIANAAAISGDTQNGKIDVVVNTKFFQAAEGDFYLSALVLENNIVNNQSGQGSNAIHTNILRTVAGESVFGVQIASGSIAQDNEVQTSFSIDLDPSWNELELDLVLIIWNKVNDDYVYVNSANTNGIFNLTSTERTLASEAYTLKGNLISEQTQLVIGQNDIVGDAQVQLVDMQGNIVKDIWNGEINTETTLEINGSDLSPATYLLRIQIGNKEAVEKLVIPR